MSRSSSPVASEKRQPPSSSRRKFTSTQMLAALGALELLFEDSLIGCPRCRNASDGPYTPKPGRVRVFEDGGLKCRKCGFWAGSPYWLLTSEGVSASQAHSILEDTARYVGSFQVNSVARPDTVSDPDVYEALVSYASISEAVRFYARFGISERVVRNSGAAMLTERPEVVQQRLVDEFSEDRVRRSGLISSRDTLLCNRQYPVIEPHHSPTGRVVGLQFRASPATERRIRAHKEGKSPYVAKFLSPVGPPEGSRPGFGLHLVADLPAGTRVAITEGFKDMLASATFGVPAIGLPGAGCDVTPEALELLRNKVAVVCFDSDAAGAAGADQVVATLVKAGVETQRCLLPEGADITDVLSAHRSSTR